MYSTRSNSYFSHNKLVITVHWCIMTVITRTADKMSGWMKEELLLKLAELSLTNRTVAN